MTCYIMQISEAQASFKTMKKTSKKMLNLIKIKQKQSQFWKIIFNIIWCQEYHLVRQSLDKIVH